MTGSWTDDRLEILRTMFAEGHSFSAIARVLSARGAYVSRNAVIGKAHRIGLGGRAANAPHRPAQASTPKIKVAYAPPPPPPEPEPDPTRGLVRTLDLRHDDCRWPIGDPLEPDFHYCAAKKETPAHPYCSHHNRRAWSHAPASAEDRRRSREAARATGQGTRMFG